MAELNLQRYVGRDGRVDLAQIMVDMTGLQKAVDLQQETNDLLRGVTPEYKSVDEIPEVKASKESKDDSLNEAKLLRDDLHAAIQEIKNKYKNKPGLFIKKRRRARSNFLSRVDNQIKRCERKMSSWIRQRSECKKLVVHDNAIDTMELQLEVRLLGVRR